MQMIFEVQYISPIWSDIPDEVGDQITQYMPTEQVRARQTVAATTIREVDNTAKFRAILFEMLDTRLVEGSLF